MNRSTFSDCLEMVWYLLVLKMKKIAMEGVWGSLLPHYMSASTPHSSIVIFFHSQYKKSLNHFQTIQSMMYIYLSILVYFSCFQHLQSGLGTRKTKSSK